MSLIGKLAGYGVRISRGGQATFRGNVYARNFPGVSSGVPSGYNSETWYVDSDISASGNGHSWDKAKKTIAEALALAGNHDVILVQKGIYDEGAVLNITQEGLKLLGMGTSGDIWGTTTIKASAADHICITVNANEVEIGNIAFVQNNANEVISIATTANTYKTHIHDCYFGGSSTQTVGVSGSTSGTYDSVDVLVENCTFYQCVTGVDLNGTRCTIRNNVFLLSAGDTAIEVSQSGGNRPELRILDNVIRGANSSDKGIYFAATPTESLFTMDGNRVYNVATPVTLAKYTSWYDGNYWGVDDGAYHSKAGESGRSGRVFFVDANAATAGDGRCWKSALKTLTAAVALATTRFDTIIMRDGDYDEGAAVAITTQGLTIRGENPFSQNRAMIYSTSGTYNLMTIDAHEVTIDGISFSVIPDTKSAIVVSGTSASYKCHFKNLRLDGWSGEYGIYLNESPDTLIEDCLFRSFNTAAVYANSTRTIIRRCIFHVVAAKIGIEHVPAGGSRPDNVYVDNLFSGATSSTTTAIKFTGAPSDGTIICARNRLCGTFDTDITQIAAHGGVDNYAADADGGSLIDTCSG